jgi:hypothetical protein
MFFVNFMILGFVFFSILWLKSEYKEVFCCDPKAKKKFARQLLLFPFWPVFFAYEVIKIFFKIFKETLRMADFKILRRFFKSNDEE